MYSISELTKHSRNLSERDCTTDLFSRRGSSWEGCFSWHIAVWRSVRRFLCDDSHASSPKFRTLWGKYLEHTPYCCQVGRYSLPEPPSYGRRVTSRSLPDLMHNWLGSQSICAVSMQYPDVIIQRGVSTQHTMVCNMTRNVYTPPLVPWKR